MMLKYLISTLTILLLFGCSKANQVKNGMGDIYRVSMDQLELD